MVTAKTFDPYAQMEDLSSYLQSYCKETGKDFAFYAATLDQSKTIDPALLNDPAFMAYWRLMSLQLTEIVNPISINSDEAMIVLPENFDSLYPATSEEMTEFNQEAVSNDSSYSAFLVTNDANQSSDSLLSSFQSAAATSGDTTGMVSASGETSTADVSAGYDMEVGGETSSMDYAADAREFAAKYGYEDELAYAIGTQEGIRSTEGSILTMLAEMDQQLVDLKEALQTGAISAEEFAADAENISIYRETLLGMMNQLESSLMTVFETLSKLVEQAIEGRMAIINNSRQV